MRGNKLEKLINDLKSEMDIDDSVKSFVEINEQVSDNELPKYQIISSHTHQPPSSKFNVIWSENKETLLFSLLSAIIVIILGLISGYEYVLFAGIIAFLLFSILVFMAFFKYITVSSSSAKIPDEISNRINMLESKLDFLSKKGKTGLGSVSGERISELENSVEELRTIVKTIVGQIK
ncbi:MAG: hypothetical protein K6357_08555 [Elusimicrobiota bacterium]